MSRLFLEKLTVLLLISLFISVLTYAANLWLLAGYLAKAYLSPKDALFIEGLVFALVGVLLLIGSGGINLWTVKGAILQSAADAITGESGEPSKVFRRDAWRPSGFVRYGLVLLFSAVIMILIYFL